MFSWNIPNILSFITIKYVKCFGNAFTLGILHALVFFKRYSTFLAFLACLFSPHTLNVGIVVFTFYHELVQGFRNCKGIRCITIELPIPPALKPCDKQKELDHFQCLVVCVDVAGEVVNLLLTELFIGNTKKDKHSLQYVVNPLCG